MGGISNLNLNKIIKPLCNPKTLQTNLLGSAIVTLTVPKSLLENHCNGKSKISNDLQKQEFKPGRK